MANIKELIRPAGAADDTIKDESCYEGMTFSKSMPKNNGEVSEIVKYCVSHGEKITVHGALTGLCGAGVPNRSHSMNMTAMNKVTYDLENCTVTAESGASFEEIEAVVTRESKMKREFPVSPTEKTATIGGAVSLGSAGVRSYKYGSVADFVEEIELCDVNGEIRTLYKKDSDFSSVFGSEGMLGVITKVKLRTVEAQNSNWGLLFFFENDESACEFADRIAGNDCVFALEYMDRACFELLSQYKNSMTVLSALPDIPGNSNAMIYTELCAQNEDKIENAAEELMEVCAEVGVDPDLAWAMTGSEIRKLRDLRHAISECINMRISENHAKDTRIKKLSADIKWKGKSRIDILNYYRDKAGKSNLQYCIFGHIGTYSPYVNIISNSAEEYIKGKELICSWSKDAFLQGGTAFSELGVGKLRRDMFSHAAPIEELNHKLKAKLRFDPQSVFNPENMFEDSVL